MKCTPRCWLRSRFACVAHEQLVNRQLSIVQLQRNRHTQRAHRTKGTQYTTTIQWISKQTNKTCSFVYSSRILIVYILWSHFVVVLNYKSDSQLRCTTNCRFHGYWKNVFFMTEKTQILPIVFIFSSHLFFTKKKKPSKYDKTSTK